MKTIPVYNCSCAYVLRTFPGVIPIPSRSIHVPVLVDEVLELGCPTAGETWIDGTAGGGGHCRAILERIGPSGRLLAVDRDPAAAHELVSFFADSPTTVRCGSYEMIPELIAELGWPKVDGILLDLGLSSDQLSDDQRGFSFSSSGMLDMRFDPTSGQPAWKWLNSASERELADAIFQYGEERFSRRIARLIVQQRQVAPIHTACELRELVARCVPTGRSRGHSNRSTRIDPATKTFQALRILVNDELSTIDRALQRLPDCLATNGRMLVISFHSLEDRLVKTAFRNDSRWLAINTRPVTASGEEIASNSRSRSAKLRAARLRNEMDVKKTRNKYAAMSKVDIHPAQSAAQNT